MNILAEKIKLIEWITKIQDFNTIETLRSIRIESPAEWSDELTEFQKREIDLGLEDIEQGNTVEHAEAKKLYEKYL